MTELKNNSQLDNELRSYFAQLDTHPLPTDLEDRAVNTPFTGRRAWGAWLGGISLIGVAAAAAVITLTVVNHNTSKAPVPAHTTNVTNVTPTPKPTSTPIATTPNPTTASSHVHLSGALTGDVPASGIAVACGGGNVRGAFTLSGTVYWLDFEPRDSSGGITPGGTRSVELNAQSTAAAQVWTGDGHVTGFSQGILNFNTNTGASVQATLIPSDAFAAPGINQAKSGLVVDATIACPPPGSPSQITMQAALTGSFTITHVNCDIPVPGSAPGPLQIVGQMNGSTYVVSLSDDNAGFSVEVTGNGKNWSGTADPGGQYSIVHGASFSATMTLNLGQGGTDPSAPKLISSGTVTCPS